MPFRARTFSLYQFLVRYKASMAKYTRYSTHTVHELSVHLVFTTKYRYHVLTGEIGKRARDIIRQVCDAQDVRIIKGVISKDHVHIHVSRPPSLSESELMALSPNKQEERGYDTVRI